MAARRRRRRHRAGHRHRRRSGRPERDLAVAPLTRAAAAPLVEIVHVSASLRADGGGTAHLGRLLGRSLRELASERRIAFRGLHLPADDGSPALDGYRSFGGSRLRLAAAVGALQAAAPRRQRLVLFDHLGPARAQALLPRALGARCAIQLHGIEVWRPLGRLASAAVRGAGLLLANSRTTAERARPFLPAEVRPVVVPLGLEPDTDGGRPDRATLERAGESFVLVVGRMSAEERYKGHDELLDALATLAARGVRPRLVIVGDGSDRARLEARAAGLALAGQVAFVGAVDAATRAELYRSSRAFALPSRGEGFGLVYLEAMAAGKPVLALAGGAAAEIVNDEIEGLLVPESDADALARALERLATDAEGAERLGRAARARYRAEFTRAAFDRRLRAALAPLVGD